MSFRDTAFFVNVRNISSIPFISLMDILSFNSNYSLIKKPGHKFFNSFPNPHPFWVNNGAKGIGKKAMLELRTVGSLNKGPILLQPPPLPNALKRQPLQACLIIHNSQPPRKRISDWSSGEAFVHTVPSPAGLLPRFQMRGRKDWHPPFKSEGGESSITEFNCK